VSTPQIPVWSRPKFEPAGGDEGEAEVALFAFSRGPLPEDVPFSMSRFGAPSREVAAALDVTTIERKADPTWFDNWRTGALRTIAERDLGDLSELDAADHVHIVRMTVDDPKDLVHLQTAWAAARWLAERGASIVLDAHASHWWKKNELAELAPDRDLSMNDEVIIVAETDESPGFGYAIHTRGMRKFGRRDVVMAGTKPSDPFVGFIVREIALAQALGGVFRPGQRIDFGEEGGELLVVWYEPGENIPELQLNNDAWLIKKA
jgi:hypothetical protein